MRELSNSGGGNSGHSWSEGAVVGGGIALVESDAVMGVAAAAAAVPDPATPAAAVDDGLESDAGA